MPREIRALLFDKDGTLFDFEKTWTGYVCEVLGVLAPDAETAQAMGAEVGFDLANGRFEDPASPIVVGPVDAIGTAWAPFLPGRAPGELTAWIDAHATAWSVDGRGLAPAAEEMPALLATFAKRAVLGVATNDSRGAAIAQLDALGVRACFAHVFGYDSVVRPKPAPDMVLAFAQAAGHDPAEIAMIGDSRHDLDAATAAGVGLRIAVLTGIARAEDLAPHADAVIPRIDALPELLARHGF